MFQSIPRGVRDFLTIALTLVLIALILFPFFWMIFSSLRPSSELLNQNYFGSELTLENFLAASQAGFLKFILNSVIVCGSATIIALLLAVPAAYAFSRYHFPGKNIFLGSIGFTQMFPWVILVTPIFMIFYRLGLANSYIGLIIVYIAVGIPFTTYMLIGYFETIPKSLDDAAVIDGCSTLEVIFRVILPISVPGLVATSTYIFAFTWNEFVFALTLMTSSSKKTVPVGLAGFFGQYSTEWGTIMAAAVLASIPTVIFFLLIQRHLVEGLAAGAIKQ